MKWIHNLLKCFSFSAVLFTFQACYGEMQDDVMLSDCEFSVRVTDGDGNGIPNVEVTMSYEDGPRVFLDTTTTAGMVYVKKGLLKSGYMDLHLNPLDNVDLQPKDTSFYHYKQYNYYTITLEPK